MRPCCSPSARCVSIAAILLAGVLASGGAVSHAQLQFEAEPINYGKVPSTDRVAQLQQQIDDGAIELDFDDKLGYLPATLKALDIASSTQLLVFSQTSLQLRKISPRRPRAVYFNDDTYVGYVQFGDVLEISAVDPQLGAVFYTLEQTEATKPRFVRDRGQCLICHASSRTQGVPGHLVRSVFVDASGRPQFGSGTYNTDQESPFKERWGGWYVTGTHGGMRHMGNVIAGRSRDPDALDRERGANRTSLEELVDTAPYLEPHSDLVSMMVLVHQAQMHNFLTLANFETRQALHYNAVMNKALERPDEYQSDSTQRRIASAAEKLVRHMLFVDEFELTSPVRGTSDFAEGFAAAGPRDRKGRSLRDLKLDGRLLKYPCSYLIYSSTFEELPQPIKQRVYERLYEVLSGADKSREYSHLTADDRLAVLEILRDTKPDLRLAFDRLESERVRSENEESRAK